MAKRKKADTFVGLIIAVALATWGIYAYIDTQLVKAGQMKQIEQSIIKTNQRLDYKILSDKRDNVENRLEELLYKESKPGTILTVEGEKYKRYLEKQLKELSEELRKLLIIKKRKDIE